jgi:hypothetical protein
MLSWPPTKEDLERLYLEERLSAEGIAARYGRSGRYPGAIVYHYLRKYGIPIRDRTAHQRHMSEEEVAACVMKYREGKSLWDLADEYHFSAETIRKALLSHGVETRDKVEAQIQKVTKHQKHPFSGDPHEKAYLYGLRQGDLWVTRHGRAIRVKTSTTHPAMIELVASCFLPYGAVHIMPRQSKMSGYEWSIDCDLDSTFEFMEWEYTAVPNWIENGTFRDYLAGFFDAEGSITLDGNHVGNPRLAITNSNLSLLEELRDRMKFVYGTWHFRLSTPAGMGGEAIAKRDVWQLQCWRNADCLNFLLDVPFRHLKRKRKHVSSYNDSKADLPNRWQRVLHFYAIQ